tara:strand:+ start:740 stop:1096 length:357 start_codon:yes stop_codon:yes gene_type:complete
MSRKVKVSVKKLIGKIEENKNNHIKSYKKAVKAYKREALEQLKKLKKEATDGSLDLKLNLVTPIDNTEKYNKLIETFEWEEEEFVELEQHEFNEFVQDETQFARDAMFSNTFYASSNG